MLKVLELFGGISAPIKALINLKIEYKTIDYVEIDPKVVTIRNAIYNSNFKPKDVINYHYNGEVDLLIGGSPCQDFSNAGLNKGGEKGSQTRSSLIWEQLRILKETKPKYYFWENVKNVLSQKHYHIFEKHNQFVESLGYKVNYWVLNAKDFGIPQNRERVFVVATRNDIEEFIPLWWDTKEMKPLKSFLEKDVDKWYYVKQNSFVENHFATNIPKGNYWGKTKLLLDNDVTNTITTNQLKNINSGLVLNKEVDHTHTHTLPMN